MTSRLEKERTKQIQDKCQDLLTQMLRDEDNKYCVDCDAKGPRWASWNLGIFLCIRCAGIHRNLGVHISKVKSVNLDTWTPEQVVSLQQMGNSRARAVYEANLPDTFRRPQTDCSLESFIRAKYEHKKYIAREWVPPTMPKVNWDKELDEEAEKQRRRKKSSIKTNADQNPLPLVKKPEIMPQLPKPGSSVSPKPPSKTPSNSTPTLDLLGLDSLSAKTTNNSNNSGDDIFSSFLSATPVTSSLKTDSIDNAENTLSNNEASKADEESFFNQPAPTQEEKSKMTKDSILALYGTQQTPQQQQQPVYGLSSGIYTQQTPGIQQFSQSLSGVGVFGQQNNLVGQQQPLQQQIQQQQQQQQHQNLVMTPLIQHSVIPPQHGIAITNHHINLATNPIGLVAATNQLGGGLQMAPINQIANLSNPTMLMQTQMGDSNGVPVINKQMVQMGPANIISNNGWSNMLTTQNIQPSPGSNPFFNLSNQTSTNSTFPSQLSQQMSQMSLGGLVGKSAPATLPGQTLSTNLWQ
ncbi:stromal membrane-associated protein 1 isoform X1 [Microplitis demolitor]|uniref:stromal membrane-associated protein 1 isoform X1 n=2 Tax=Microplitis demolitor TaxID=69319 RepID=UPI0004CD004E|nr:stromal membrane-associated protein 1 isoform X1 [Microplitis demolitor]